MSEVLIVLRREFLERVRSRAFLIGTILFPLFMAAMWILPAMLGSGGGGTRRIVIVDQAPAGVAALTEQTLTAPPAPGAGKDDDRITYVVEQVRQPLAQVRPQLIKRVQAKEIDGWLYLPPDVVQSSQAQYRARNVANFSVLGDLSRAASRAVQAARLQASGIQPAQVAALVKPVELSTMRVTDRGEEGGSAVSSFFVSYIVGFLTYFMILLYGMNVLRSVLEEKTNKIAEVIVSSMKASHLMLGKILGVGGVALLQVGLWALITSLLARRSNLLASRFHLPPGTLDVVHVPLPSILALLAFFVLGFLLYSAVYAALGAAVNSEQEAQQFQMLVLLPLIVPILFVGRVVADPLGQTATILGMIPFTAPVTMAMRLASTPVPAVQVIGSLVLMVLTVLAVAWLAGKIYRVGILSTGKRPTLAELGQWLRAA
jgi:ABC-2 type transport system permease protein